MSREVTIYLCLITLHKYAVMNLQNGDLRRAEDLLSDTLGALIRLTESLGKDAPSQANDIGIAKANLTVVDKHLP